MQKTKRQNLLSANNTYESRHLLQNLKYEKVRNEFQYNNRLCVTHSKLTPVSSTVRISQVRKSSSNRKSASKISMLATR